MYQHIYRFNYINIDIYVFAIICILVFLYAYLLLNRKGRFVCTSLLDNVVEDLPRLSRFG